MSHPVLEVADIFRGHGPAWRKANAGHVSLGQLKVMSAIESCRTAALGGHVARCEDCTYTTIAYNSCRNRHCPKCQGAAAKQWLAERAAELLPVPYFHVVFTLPAQIADIAYHNKAVIYNLLFTASAETMITIAADPKRLGARIGLISVLHTWGSAMTHHPHVHMIVPGAGLSLDGNSWVSCRPRFLLPAPVLSHQLVISSRARRRAPNLNSFDRFLLGLGSLFVPPNRLPKLAVILKPRTLLKFHEALKKCKYRWLFSSGGHRRPGPKGPSKELIDAIVEIKRRNPRVGCPRIAQEIAHAFDIDINKDIVRRVLAKHYRPEAGTDGPSWLSFIGHVKDSLWSVDLFRCESILLRSHWVMVVMDVFTRRIIGFGVESADLCGASVCRMFNRIIAGKALPRHLSSDHDPLFRFHRWRANLRIFEVEEIKSIPYVPMSHPFVERLIGTVRREFLDHVLIWNAIDLERKLEQFRIYYNESRVHQSLSGRTPGERSGEPPPVHAVLDHYAWRHHCRGLFQMPIAA